MSDLTTLEKPASPKRRRRGALVITDSMMRKVRIVAFIVFAVIALPLIALSVKYISANALADNAQTAYQRRAWSEAEMHARGLGWWNFFEEWKAHYNLGVALGMGGDYEGALTELETALELIPEDQVNNQCVIVTNIVYLHEMQGDDAVEAGDQQTANDFYYEALDLIESAPEGCFEPPAEGEANTEEQLTEAVPRIEAKIVEDDSSGGDESDGEGGDGEGESEGEGGEDGEQEQPMTPEEQLQEQNEQAQEQQQQQEQYEQGGGDEGDPNAPPVDQPW